MRNDNQNASFLPPETTSEARVQTFHNLADRVCRRGDLMILIVDEFDCCCCLPVLVGDGIYNMDMMELGSTTS